MSDNRGCYTCGDQNHFARECPKSMELCHSGRRSNDNKCYNCGGVGHISRECPSGTGAFMQIAETGKTEGGEVVAPSATSAAGMATSPETATKQGRAQVVPSATAATRRGTWPGTALRETARIRWSATNATR